MFAECYRNTNVLVTGHTGFKGSWLSAWLVREGANLCGFSLAEHTDPYHYSLLDLSGIRSETGDIRNAEKLRSILTSFQPEIIFHLAAQPLVRRSYAVPAETFETNVMGTVNVLDAARRTPSVRAIVVVTSDKCYENRSSEKGYTEDDPLGGYDPYSASKGCAELTAACYRRSFLAEKGILLATARAGNVVGGGDWAEDRLVSDLMRAAVRGEVEQLRNPNATRPWQHVLEPLSGYLLLGQRLLEGSSDFAEAWNFGPDDSVPVTVGEAASLLHSHWNRIRFSAGNGSAGPHEADKLQLDCTKARTRLLWKPIWNTNEALKRTAEWYRNYYEKNQTDTLRDLQDYLGRAEEMSLIWTR